MKKIGFVMGGHSEFNDQVWDSLNKIVRKYKIGHTVKLYPEGRYQRGFKALIDNQGIDFWFLLPSMALAGAIIKGAFQIHDVSDETVEGQYEILIQDADTIDHFCIRLEKIAPFCNFDLSG